MSTRSARSLWRDVGILAAASFGALAGAVIVMMIGDWFRPPSPTIHLTSGLSTPFILPGLKQPATKSAAEASVKDDAEVIGISVDGRHRAYLMEAMNARTSHVINDLLGTVPVTVTYCNLTGCARAFTAEDRVIPLDFSLGGFNEEEMLLRVGEVFYLQGTGRRMHGRDEEQIPYPTQALVRTTWKQWKEAHPDTDIFVGVPPPGDGPPP